VSLQGIPGMTEGCQANMSQFSLRKVRKASAISGSMFAPLDVVLAGSVGCTCNFTISLAGLNEVDFGCLLRMTSS